MWLAWLFVCGTPAALVLSLPPFNLWPLAFIALVPFFLYLRNPAVTSRQIFRLSTLVGAIYWAVLYHMFFANVPYPWLQIAPWIIWTVAIILFLVLAFLVGLSWGFYAWAARRLMARAPRGLVFWLAAGWVLIELIRSFLHWQVTWGMSLGYSLPPTNPLGQVASLGGIWLVAFGLVVVNWQMTDLLAHPFAAKHQLKYVLLTFLIWSVAGWSLKAWLNQALQPGEQVTAVALQTSQDSSGLLLNSFRYDQLLHKVNSLTSATPTSPQVIVMPEVAYAIDPSGTQKMTSRPSQMVYSDPSTLAAATIQKITPQTTLIAGFVDTTNDAAWQNGALVANRETSPAFISKRLLFPFGEYLPLEKLWPAAVQQFYRYKTQPSGRLPLTPLGAVSVLFCNEVFVPSRAVSDVAAGAKIITVLSSNFDVGTPWYAVWQERAASYRAVETWRPLILATDQAQAAVIDPAGRIRAQVPFTTTGVAQAAVPIIDRSSPWVVLQPIWRGVAATLGLLLIWLLSRPNKELT